MNYTDNQLKVALAKMLPDTLQLVPYGREDNLILCWNLEGLSEPVRNTELLHLCWVVEENLNVYESAALLLAYHASWQERVIALAAVKEIEI